MTDRFMVHLIGKISDEYMMEAMPDWESSYAGRTHRFRGKKIGRIAAAILILFILISALSVPSIARKLPFLQNIFEYVGERFEFYGSYTNYATQIDHSAVYGGISITVKEAYCDGTYLYVSYQIESEKPLRDYMEGDFCETQLGMIFDAQIVSDEGANKLYDPGTYGINGKLADDYTYVGVELYSLDGLNGKEFPEQFDFYVQIYDLELLPVQADEESGKIHGNWSFQIPIKVNAENVSEVYVGKCNNGHSIDRVVCSPAAVTVYTSYPDIYQGTVRYQVYILDEASEEELSFMGCYDTTSGITVIPRERVKDTFDVYVVDAEVLEEQEIRLPSREQLDEYSIVKARINCELGR